jgi:3-oxoadipate enol-lactonase
MSSPPEERATLTTSDGCPIAYTLRRASHSNATRLVLVHSLALDERVWNGVVTKLKDDFDVLTYDCRGHGHSGRQASTYTTELFARDLAELLDTVGWQTAVVAGCSMGGNVAQAFAARHPAKTSALALIDTTAWYGEGAPERWQERADSASARGLASLVDFQVMRWLGDEFRAAHPELVRALVDVFLANDVRCYASACAMMGSADSRSYLSSLRMPVAVVVGEEDYATPVASARFLHDAIAGSTMSIIPSARHLTVVECPDRIADEIRALVRRLAPAASDPGLT